ncbi:MAG: MFS transporter [Actinobacteria bacterium]|nr:MFS transporter [Actinomycetota bacterium]
MTQELGASAFIYGLVGTAFAVGSLGGATWVASYKAPENKHVHMVIAGLVMLAIAVLGISLAWHWGVVLFFSLLAGLGNAIINSYGIGIFINNSAQEIQGRILAGVSGVINTGGIVAMGLAGVLIGLFGVREVLLGGALLSLAVLALLSPAVFRQVPKFA